jgi:hypothetical protein
MRSNRLNPGKSIPCRSCHRQLSVRSLRFNDNPTQGSCLSPCSKPGSLPGGGAHSSQVSNVTRHLSPRCDRQPVAARPAAS